MSRLKSAGRQRDFLLFCLAGAFLGVYSGLYDPTFNNYIAETFKVSEATRGGLEFFRELPGFLTVVLASVLLVLADIRIAMVSLLVLSWGLFGQGFFAPTLQWAVVWMIMWSAGSHLFLPMSNSITVSLSEPGEVGRKLGKWSAINTATSLIGYIIVWGGFRYFHLNYRFTFALASLMAVLAVICLWGMKIEKIVRPTTKIMIKKKYTLYYVLSVLFGARKQIFLTFGPWVLIKIFHQPVPTFAALGMVGTALGIFLNRHWA